MTLTRRRATRLIASLPALAGVRPAAAQARKDSVVLGMVLEPPGLDPTQAPSAAIGEIVHLNILEGLTRIGMDGAVTPLLADSWRAADGGKRVTFLLKAGVHFSDGAPCTAQAVKFSFERAKAANSTNKGRKNLFDNIQRVELTATDSVTLVLEKADALLPFRLGENTAVILHPDTAAGAATKPVGTGPYKLDSWNKGSSVTLVKWDGHRNAAQVAMRKVVFRFIDDPAAQVAALLAGDVDAFPRFSALPALPQFQKNARFTVQVGSTSGKGILAINNRRPPFTDVRVRRALAHAIDRKAFIAGAEEGLGLPIGSHFVPSDAGYLDLTAVTPYDPAKARALLKAAGVATPLKVTLTLPPVAYARKGGEIVAAQLAQVGVVAKIENVEWAQWLAGPFKGQFDLTIINHVEPLDHATAYADPNYYFGYDSAEFRGLVARMAASTDEPEKARLWREIQRLPATDAVNVFIWNPAQVAVFKRGLRGVWINSPIAANDMAAVSWAPGGST